MEEDPQGSSEYKSNGKQSSQKTEHTKQKDNTTERSKIEEIENNQNPKLKSSDYQKRRKKSTIPMAEKTTQKPESD